MAATKAIGAPGAALYLWARQSRERWLARTSSEARLDGLGNPVGDAAIAHFRFRSSSFEDLHVAEIAGLTSRATQCRVQICQPGRPRAVTGVRTKFSIVRAIDWPRNRHKVGSTSDSPIRAVPVARVSHGGMDDDCGRGRPLAKHLRPAVIEVSDMSTFHPFAVRLACAGNGAVASGCRVATRKD